MSAEQQGKKFLASVAHYFDKAAALTGHHESLLKQIKMCNSVYSFQFPIQQKAAVMKHNGVACRTQPSQTAG